MLRIQCPWCGERDQTEFRCGGQSHIIRPVDPSRASDQEWADYLFYRDNPKGVHHERWVHAWGCRQWFNMARDTVTHEILEVYPMTASAGQEQSTPSPPGVKPE
jgi:heterotetrameric sarcosine oxidase delta subunit